MNNTRAQQNIGNSTRKAAFVVPSGAAPRFSACAEAVCGVISI
ncbi:MAG: hypothetical protein Q7S86_02885 [bacterium]|nr:hypothetical protein [bacterium]